MREFTVAVFPGDGIGHEVMAPCLDCSRASTRACGVRRCGSTLRGGGRPVSPHGRGAAARGAAGRGETADAVLLGAMGLPDVRYPDGTEVAPHLDFRERFGLYAGVRPVRVLAGARTCRSPTPRARRSTACSSASRPKGCSPRAP
jgi:3-isopropylmalate dehydrogenase